MEKPQLEQSKAGFSQGVALYFIAIPQQGEG
jgi:hypothetical protein